MTPAWMYGTAALIVGVVAVRALFAVLRERFGSVRLPEDRWPDQGA